MASNDRHNNPAGLSEGYQSTEFDDSFNSVDIDAKETTNVSKTEDSYNQESKDSHDDNSTDVSIKDSFDKEFTDNSDNNSNNKTDVDVDDSFNKSQDSHDDNSTDTDVDLDVDLDNAFNDVTDSNNDNSTDNSTDDSTNVDVSLADSFNDSSTNSDSSSDDDVKDSYNDNSTDFDLDVGIKDSFNPSDDDLVDVGDLSGYLAGILGNHGDALYNPGNIALQGDGNIFDIDQALNLSDADTLSGVSLTNNSSFNQQAWDLQGGHSDASSDGTINPGEGDVAAGATASASGMAQLEAFNQTITMGANIQYVSIDMDVIGGSDHGSLYGDDA